ncbi:hypothetical protein OW567_06665, partial [Acidithiobacillus ferriphilus]|uniref:hypothetical protein n=1 Tax=Acidithiobacillus ferriphilus TaxID=1689834 RepID=UPI002DB8F25D
LDIIVTVLSKTHAIQVLSMSYSALEHTRDLKYLFLDTLYVGKKLQKHMQRLKIGILFKKNNDIVR